MSITSVGKLLNNVNGLSASQQNAVRAIQQASAKTGVDFAYLVQKANIESGLDSTAKAKTSTATGLYQFVQNTWLDMVDRHGAEYGLQGAADAIQRDASGRPYVANKQTRDEILALRNNPQIAAGMAADLAAENASALQDKVGGKIGATEMYLAHFLGAGGAAELLQAKNANPNTPAARLLPEAAAANQNVFYTDGGRARTVAEVYDNFAKKFDGTAVADMPAAKAPVSANKNSVNDAIAALDRKAMQVLATITPEADAVAAVQSPTTLAFNAPSTVPDVLGDSTQYNAMMMAQKIIASAGGLAKIGADEKRSVI